MKMGNSTMGLIVGLCSVAGSVVAPTLYMSGIKGTVDGHEWRLSSLESSQIQTTKDIKDLNTKIDALLWRQGINPSSLISKN